MYEIIGRLFLLLILKINSSSCYNLFIDRVDYIKIHLRTPKGLLIIAGKEHSCFLNKFFCQVFLLLFSLCVLSMSL